MVQTLLHLSNARTSTVQNGQETQLASQIAQQTNTTQSSTNNNNSIDVDDENELEKVSNLFFSENY